MKHIQSREQFIGEAVEVKTNRYQRTHGKKPKGFGQWAFYFDDMGGEPMFVPKAMNYSDAVKWAKGEAKKAGKREIYVGESLNEGKYDKMVDKGDGHIHFILKDEKSAERLADKIEEEGLGDCDFYPQGKKIYLRVSLTGQEDKVNVNVPKIEKIVGMKAKSGSPETWDGYMLGEDEVFTEGVKGYSAAERMEMGKKGLALPDGSFPIRNLNDLKNAIMAYGRAKDQSAAAKFIAKRAKALNAEDLIPDTEDFQKALKEAEFGRIPKFGE